MLTPKHLLALMEARAHSDLLSFGAETHRGVSAAFCVPRKRESFVDIPVCTDQSTPAFNTLPQLHLARLLFEHFARVALSHDRVLRHQLFLAAGAHERALIPAR